MNFLSRLFGHLKTITKHRHMVIKHCFKAGIFLQGLLHDMSKYTPEEFFNGVKYYQGTRSPNEAERENIGFSYAWMHHKGRNKHHFEYWTDYCPSTKKMEPVEMPIRYVAEMFCDRVAASKIYNKGNYSDEMPLEYFLKAKGRRVIHPKTSDLIEFMLEKLSKDGEKAAFLYVKSILKCSKHTKKAVEDRKNA